MCGCVISPPYRLEKINVGHFPPHTHTTHTQTLATPLHIFKSSHKPFHYVTNFLPVTRHSGFNWISHGH